MTHSFSSQGPSVPTFTWQSSKTLLFYFAQTLLRLDLAQVQRGRIFGIIKQVACFLTQSVGNSVLSDFLLYVKVFCM